MLSIVKIIVSLLLASASAYKVSLPSFQLKPRAAIAVITGSALSLTLIGSQLVLNPNAGSVFRNQYQAVAAETSVFTGDYKDPNHPGCLRNIELKDTGLFVKGKC